MIYTIRTTSGREDIVIDLLMSKIQQDNIDIKSVFHPAEIKGYVFIEGSIGSVHKAMHGLMHSRGLINKPIGLGEIQHFLESKKTRLKVDDGDIIEIIGGPFKAEKGRIKRVNKIKDEVTVELLEATIPIPVTIATEFVKMVKKAKPSKKEEKLAAPEKEDEKSVFDKVDEVGEEKPQEEKKPGEEKPKEEPEKKEAPEKPKKEPAPAKKPEKEFKKEEKPKKKVKSFLEELEEEEGK